MSFVQAALTDAFKVIPRFLSVAKKGFCGRTFYEDNRGREGEEIPI